MKIKFASLVLILLFLVNPLYADSKEELQPAGFIAGGVDKTWSLEISFTQRTMRFVAKGNSKFTLITTLKKPLHPDDNNLICLNDAEDQDSCMNITISQTPCDNQNPYSHEVTVTITNIADSGILFFKGCGQYTGDFRLNETWILESLNGITIDAKQGSSTPSLQFNFYEGLLTGFTGCNRINGVFNLTDHTIQTGLFATTRKSCPDMETENRFIQTIAERTLRFSIENTRLTVNNGVDLLIFRKSDK